MADLIITSAQPNPPGRDVARPGVTSNSKLNEEWVEFTVQRDRSLIEDQLSHLTFNNYCHRTGQEVIFRFGIVRVKAGQRVRVHTGSGTDYWEGSLLHVYAGRSWFVWNNACGDRATLSYGGTVIDSAYYEPNPPEGVLVRQPGTDRLVPAPAVAWRW